MTRPGRDVEDEDRGAVIPGTWDANAAGWTRAVRDGLIPSRKAATDAAVIEAVLALDPRRVLDVGCGEGWLARALAGKGLDVLGVDGSAALVEAARAGGGAEFAVCAYDDLIAEPERVGDRYDVAVFNFALLDRRVAPLLAAVRTRLQPRGAVVIQTVHPWTSRGEEGYRDGWRTETFSTLPAEAGFARPMPWYFRTLESWAAELHDAGLRIGALREPAAPDGGDPLSLVLTAYPAPQTFT